MQTIHLGGAAYVILEQQEYARLATLAKAGELPPLPPADRDGNFPAVEYGRASLARKIIRARSAAGLSQQDLAERAGVAGETLCRIERGKTTPALGTLEKIDRALQAAAKKPASAKRPAKRRK